MATEWEEISRGLRVRKLDTGFTHVRIHYSTDPLKDDSWARRLSAKYGGMETPKWRREFEIDYSAVRGQPVYPMLSKVHVVSNSIVERTLFRVVDHGIRHQMVCLWIAVARNGDRHVYREYFRSGATIEVNCQEVLRRTPDDEYAYATYIDPSTRQRIPLSNKDKQLVSHLSLYNNAFGSSCFLLTRLRARLATHVAKYAFKLPLSFTWSADFTNEMKKSWSTSSAVSVLFKRAVATVIK